MHNIDANNKEHKLIAMVYKEGKYQLGRNYKELKSKNKCWRCDTSSKYDEDNTTIKINLIRHTNRYIQYNQQHSFPRVNTYMRLVLIAKYASSSNTMLHKTTNENDEIKKKEENEESSSTIKQPKNLHILAMTLGNDNDKNNNCNIQINKAPMTQCGQSFHMQ